MTTLLQTDFHEAVLDDFAAIEGRIAVFLDENGRMDPLARKIDQLTKGAIKRLAASGQFARAKPGTGVALAFPFGLAADAVLVVKLARKHTAADARKAGAAVADFSEGAALTVMADGLRHAPEMALGLNLKAYEFDTYQKPDEDRPARARTANILVKDPKVARTAFAPLRAQAEGVFLTRDLVSEPANVLSTTEFADRLTGLRDIGVEVEVLDEADLERLGMRALLAVGRGSETPSQVVVMQWKGAGDAAPFALAGKGVVFDTGGISIKPAAGMEEMTMDMGGAAVVAGVMRAIALRKAAANVVGVVGLTENMPDGKAQRPGDVVRSMKGDTIEVINTDAEGRLVLADILWYIQERFKPSGVIDLATLTGAVIIALGHENAGVFSNDDKLANGFLKAAATEGEGAWRMPLASAYDRLLKSRIADMANIGGRTAGAITAAQFIQRFVRDGMPWVHLDIAGVAYVSKDTGLSPKGATGWGVRAIDRLIRDEFET